MTIQQSAIDSTKPDSTDPTTQSVRDNFEAARVEINALFEADDSAKTRLSALENETGLSPRPFIVTSRTALQNLPAYVQTTVQMDSVQATQEMTYDNQTGVFTCAVSGLYFVDISLCIVNKNGAGKCQASMTKNGSLARQFGTYPTTSEDTTAINAASSIYLQAGDSLSVIICTDRNADLSAPFGIASAIVNQVSVVKLA